MLIHWFQFISAAVLLLIPMGLFHGPKVRYRAIRRTWRGYWLRFFTLGQHAIDFGRAALGGWLLLRALEFDPHAHLPAWGLPALTAGLVVVAVVLQMVVCKEPKSINACYAFLIGLAFGLLDFPTAAFAVLGTVALSCGARMPMAFFPVLSILTFALGAFLGEWKPTLALIVCAAVVLIPWLSSMLFLRALVVTYRAKRAEPA
ncbi:MAG: hypothetical protein JSS11_01140 [Verrucomicrobia bacterium]|nr:hypothetical protein [Verrucomicrobiota bacterium]